MADAAYKLTRRKGKRATVVRVSSRTVNKLTGEKVDNTTINNIRLVYKEQTAYSRIIRAQATQETIGGTTFIFWTRDVPFTRLDVEDYIIMEGVKHQVVTSVVEDTSLVVTAKEIVGVVATQNVTLSLSNSLSIEGDASRDLALAIGNAFSLEGNANLLLDLGVDNSLSLEDSVTAEIGIEASNSLSLEDTATPVVGEPAEFLFFAVYGQGKIYRVETDGSNLTEIHNENAGGSGMLYVRIIPSSSPAAMFFTWSASTFQLQRVNLDGTGNVGIPAGGAVPVGGLRAMALDPANSHIYYVTEDSNKLGRINYDGSGDTDILTTGFTNAQGLDIDLVNGKLYFTDYSDGTIERSDLDGSNRETLVSGLGQVFDVRLDVAGGKMYWVEYNNGEIRRANLDGTGGELLVDVSPGQPGGLALDLADGKIYWTEDTTNQIQRANLDGSNLETVVATGSRPWGIDLV